MRCSATVHVTLFQPPVKLEGNGLGVAIDGEAEDGMVPLSIADHGPDVMGMWHMRHPPRAAMGPGMASKFTRGEPPRLLLSRNVDFTTFYTSTSITYSVRTLHEVVLPMKPSISGCQLQRGVRVGSASHGTMALLSRATMSGRCRQRFNPHCGVTWSAAVLCWCGKGENSPRAGGWRLPVIEPGSSTTMLVLVSVS